MPMAMLMAMAMAMMAVRALTKARRGHQNTRAVEVAAAVVPDVVRISIRMEHQVVQAAIEGLYSAFVPRSFPGDRAVAQGVSALEV